MAHDDGTLGGVDCLQHRFHLISERGARRSIVGARQLNGARSASQLLELPHHPIPGGSPHPQASDQHDVCHVLHLPPVETRRPYRTRVTTPDAGDEFDQPLWAGRATRHASSLVSLRTYEEPRRELAFALDLDDPAGYAYEVVLDQPVGRFRDLD